MTQNELKILYRKVEVGDLVRVKIGRPELCLILEKDLFTDFGFFLLILKNGKKEWVLFTEGLNNDRFHFFPKT